MSLLLLTHFTAEKFFSVCVSGEKIGLVVPVFLTLTFLLLCGKKLNLQQILNSVACSIPKNFYYNLQLRIVN